MFLGPKGLTRQTSTTLNSTFIHPYGRVNVLLTRSAEGLDATTEAVHGRAGATSVWVKSSPVNSRGSP